MERRPPCRGAEITGASAACLYSSRSGFCWARSCSILSTSRSSASVRRTFSPATAAWTFCQLTLASPWCVLSSCCSSTWSPVFRVSITQRNRRDLRVPARLGFRWSGLRNETALAGDKESWFWRVGDREFAAWKAGCGKHSQADWQLKGADG